MPSPATIDWSRPYGLWGPANPWTRPIPWGLGDVAAGFALILAVNVIPAALLIMLIVPRAIDNNEDPMDVIESIMNSGPFLMFSLLSLWAVFIGIPLRATNRKGSKSMRVDFGYQWAPLRNIGLGIALAVALRGLEFVAVTVAPRLGVDMSTADNSTFLTADRAWVWTLLLAIGASIGAPIAEEIWFRGLVLKAFMRQSRVAALHIGPVRLGTAIAVLASSALFGLLHTTAFTSGGAFVAAVTASLGIALAIVTVKTKTLTAAMSCHIAFNSSAVALLLAHTS